MNELDVFTAALELTDSGARSRFLDEACGGQPELRIRIDALLRNASDASSYLESPLQRIQATIDQPAVERPGTHIGPYKLLQQIGEGGMGVVFMAEQTEPIARRVALKIIKPGMDSRQIIARFEAERQALAMMDHVNIARVLDAGTTQSGRPYFVMELVNGVPITKYCDDNRLTPRQRLELFVPVCQAIQHAHQKGIIHRDIKPSNVMVTLYDGKPVPKVIDFGVAKATEQKLTERTLFTQYGTLIGTLEYMSPEQAEMSALGVDTRSDIYSLGVLLYELLTGSTPLSRKRLNDAAYGEILRMIKEEEPQKPSTRLSESGEHLASISAQRHTELAKLSKLMRGELDWIVMKTLEKDRNRRYETANGFAADVLRYLNDEPVQACPPSAGYRFRKFARRNMRVLTTITLLGLMLLAAVGTVAGSLGWVSRGRAARQLIVEQAVSRALEEADELQKQGKWQEALVAVERAQAALIGSEGSGEVQQQVTDQLTDLRLIQRLDECRTQRADILDNERQAEAYSQIFTDIGIEVESLSPPAAAALILRQRGTAVQVAAALDDWALVLRDCGFRDDTLDPAAWKRRLEVARLADPDPWRGQLRQLMGQEDLDALRKLADASDVAALPVQSLQLMGSALIIGGDAPACIAWLRNAHRQHPEDALIAFELAFHLSSLPAPNWSEVLRFAEAALAARPSAGLYHFVGFALTSAGRNDEAAAVHRKAIELKPDYALAYGSLGDALRHQGLRDDAIAVYRKAIELDPVGALAHTNLGIALSDQGRHNEAIAALRVAIELKPDSAWAHIHFLFALSRKGQHEEAIAAGRKAIELQPDLANAHDALGYALSRNRQLDEAITAYAKAVELKPDFATANTSLANALREVGRLIDAIVAYRKVVELNPNDAWAHTDLGVALSDSGQHDEAIAAHRKAVKLTPDSAWAHVHLLFALSRNSQHDEAIAAGRRAIELQPDLANAHDGLGFAFSQSGQLDEAIASYGKAVELKQDYFSAHVGLGHVLRQKGRLDDAIAAYRKAVVLNPGDTWVHGHLGVALSESGQQDEAIAAHRKAVERAPDSAWAHIHLVYSLSRKGWHDDAIAAGRKAIELQPDLANAHTSLGYALSENAQHGEAIAVQRKAIELQPRFALAHRGLAYSLSKNGQLDEAIDAYRTAIELDPNSAVTYSSRALAYTATNQWDKAAADYTKALQLEPQDPLAHNNVAWLFATCPDQKVRDAVRAIELAKRAVELNPNEGKYWNTLGLAHYRAEDWKAASAALTKSIELRKGGDTFDWLFLAMTHWQLGEKDEARQRYSQAVDWMKQNKSENAELKPFLDEAGELLGVNHK